MEATKRVAEKRGWDELWIDDAPKQFVPDNVDPEWSVVAEHDSLQVAVASPKFILAMKLLAARERDVEDIKLLSKMAGVHTQDQARKLVDGAYARWFQKEENPSNKRLKRLRAAQMRTRIEQVIQDVYPEGSIKKRMPDLDALTNEPTPNSVHANLK